MEGVLYGKKCVLFDFTPVDLPQFVKLHREDDKGYMMNLSLSKMSDTEATQYITMMLLTKQIKIWSCYTKERNAKCLGFIYLTDMTSFSCMVSGIMDKEVAKGLLKQIRHNKYTYAEDCLHTMVKACFNGMGYNRVETKALAKNRKSLALSKKVGFVQEGTARGAFKMDDEFYDIILLSLLKKEWKEEENGKK